MNTELSMNTDRWTSCDEGHRHWGEVGAAGLLMFSTGENGEISVLLQHRGAEVDCGGTWSIPGGALHWEETAVNGAIREAAEELDMLPELKVRAVIVDDHGGWAYATVFAECEKFDPESTGEDTAWETGDDGFEWVSLEILPTMELHPGMAANLPLVLATFSAL